MRRRRRRRFLLTKSHLRCGNNNGARCSRCNSLSSLSLMDGIFGKRASMGFGGVGAGVGASADAGVAGFVVMLSSGECSGTSLGRALSRTVTPVGWDAWLLGGSA